MVKRMVVWSTWRRQPNLGLVVSMLAMAACTADHPPAALGASTATVEALIGDATCDADAQCHTVAVGAKACGGPERYLAWSSRRTDGATLRAAAERETLAARANLASSGVMSNCALVTDPGAYCAAPEARAGSAASGASSRIAPGRQCQVRAGGPGGAVRTF